MTQQRIHLLIIDPQNDFCDLPESYCPADPQTAQIIKPALPVVGAHADMRRLATLIDQCGARLSEITVTLDSHQHIDIGHPTFWQTGQGAPIGGFTQITAADVETGRLLPRQATAKPRVLAYLQALEAAGRYTHMVWPVHCEIGTWGHNLHHDLRLACNRWEESTQAMVGKLVKGTNPWTEHYSAVQAEVPDPQDESTQLNQTFINQLRQSDTVWIAGEASSHCVKASVEHIVENIGADHVHKLVLIEDCMSPVTGFEALQTRFFADMRARGLRLAKAATLMSE